MKKLLLLLLLSLCSTAQQVTTFAGFVGDGYQDGPIATAKFDGPYGACFDTVGNMYVADTFNNKIRKISADGIVTTIAGSGEGFADGTGTAAMFHYPRGICIDPMGNLYVADENNHRIRKITPEGVVTTIAGSSSAGSTNGIGSLAKFNFPWGICIDSNGNLYITDSLNHQIRKITPLGLVSTFAGSTMGYADGTGTTAKFWFTSGICIDGANNLYVADQNNHKIRKITPFRVVTTVAGSTWGYTDGPANIAQFKYPSGICIDNNNNLFIANTGTHNIRKIDIDGNVITYAGGSTSGNVDGLGTAARFAVPTGICFASNGTDIYVTQNSFGTIRKIAPTLSSTEFIQSKIVIYPNPCNDKFSIITNENIKKISIYNLLGHLALETKCINNDVVLDKKLVKGIYFVHVVSNNNDIFTTKLIIE